MKFGAAYWQSTEPTSWYRDRKRAATYAEWVSREVERAEILIHNPDGTLADPQSVGKVSQPV
jgi:hypothetical protein